MVLFAVVSFIGLTAGALKLGTPLEAAGEEGKEQVGQRGELAGRTWGRLDVRGGCSRWPS